jgi:hypothetical protein
MSKMGYLNFRFQRSIHFKDQRREMEPSDESSKFVLFLFRALFILLCGVPYGGEAYIQVAT